MREMLTELRDAERLSLTFRFTPGSSTLEPRSQSEADTLKASVGAGAIDDVLILVQSYSELTPVSCNETGIVRDLNRRVEVWIRDHRR